MGDIKIYDLDSAIDRCNIKFFVETGTLNGDAIEYMRQYNLQKYVSFEIMPELAEKASNRFKDDDRVKIVCGDSSEILSDELKDLDGNIIFWLDAHFPGADIGIRSYGDEDDPDRNLPLEREVEVIKSRARDYNDIIIIDDLWIYEDDDYEWGAFDTHMENHGHSIRRKDLKCGDASFIREAFKHTHDLKIVYKYQGSYVLTPKLK